MDMTLAALRTIDIVVTLSAILALMSIAMQAKERRLVYVGAFTYLAHSLIYEVAILVVTSDKTIDTTFFLFWVIGLRLQATLTILIYGIYFTRLLALRNK